MIPERKCETCTHYYCDAMGDYGSWPYDVGCRFFDNKPDEFQKVSGIDDDPGDLDAFPFSDPPPCYEMEFWTTDFANDVDGSQESLNAAYERFRAFLDQGHPL